MRHQTFLSRTLLLLTAGSFCAAPSVAATRCEDLVQLSLGTTAVTSSQVVPAGHFRPANANGRGAAAQQQLFAKLPAFCRVSLTAKPASDSDIKIEVWLPESGWNGKFQAVGEGGLGRLHPLRTDGAGPG